jgi:hypothetical protein
MASDASVVSQFENIDRGQRRRVRGWRQLVIGVETVNPGVNISGVDVEAGIELCTGLGDPFGLPGEPPLLLRVGLDTFVSAGGDVVHARQHSVGDPVCQCDAHMRTSSRRVAGRQEPVGIGSHYSIDQIHSPRDSNCTPTDAEVTLFLISAYRVGRGGVTV